MDRSQAPSPPRRKLRLSLGSAVVLALIVLSTAVGVGLLRGQAAPAESVPLTDSGTAAPTTDDLYVHVLGAVTSPGLYVLAQDARLVDALAAAGGTAADADLTAVNLARVLEDGEQIVVPAIGATSDGPGERPPPGDDRIDLNAADQAALETLPRIGPALAERIIAWRDENGSFASVDDLLAVPGIGEKLLSGLRDGVRV